MAELHKALPQNDFRGCVNALKAHTERYVISDGNYFEGGNSWVQ
jgi:hypothetical protein